MLTLSTMCRSGAVISLMSCCDVAVTSLMALMYMAGNTSSLPALPLMGLMHMAGNISSLPALHQPQERPLAFENAPSPAALVIASAAESQIHYPLARPCKDYAFIHVGKNGGTNVEQIFSSSSRLKQIRPRFCCSHGAKVRNNSQYDRGTCFVTFVRDPVDRWVSGYLSRWRMGCPSHCHRKPTEEWVWNTFPSPNHLAEAFSSTNKTIRHLALKAHYSIRHLHGGFDHYLDGIRRYIDRFVFVGLTCNMRRDLSVLVRAVSSTHILPLTTLSEDVNLFWKRAERNSRVSHRNPTCFEPLKYISSLGRRNIQNLMWHDYRVLETIFKAGLITSTNITALCKALSHTPQAPDAKKWSDLLFKFTPILKSCKGDHACFVHNFETTHGC